MCAQKQILYALMFILFVSSTAHGTAQAPEIVFYEDRPYNLYNTSPLEPYFETPENRPKFQISRTDRYRGYVGMWEIVLQIESGKVVNEKTVDNTKNALLINAAREGNLEDAQTALAGGADINTTDNLWGNPLISASGMGHSKIVNLLIDKGADVNAKTRSGRTALKEAKEYGHTDIVKILEDAGAKE
jgi:ankyrin repeat protein